MDESNEPIWNCDNAQTVDDFLDYFCMTMGDVVQMAGRGYIRLRAWRHVNGWMVVCVPSADRANVYSFRTQSDTCTGPWYAGGTAVVV